MMNTSKFVDINGSKIHYIEEGKGDPILFLHGIPTSSFLWRNIIPILSKRARCIAPDLIGMGQSDKPKIQYDFEQHFKYINAFIEKLELKNITLVLHEFGSIIGFSYAMNHPNNIKGIAFYESFIHPINDYDKISLPVQELIHSFSQEPNYGYKKIVEDNFLINKLLPGIALNQLSNEAKDYYQKPFANQEAREMLWHYVKELYLSDYCDNKLNTHIENYAAFLQKSSIPKLLLHSNPGFNTSIDSIKWCQDNLPNIQLADLDEGLHLAQETSPYLFGAILLEWYRNISTK